GRAGALTRVPRSHGTTPQAGTTGRPPRSWKLSALCSPVVKSVGRRFDHTFHPSAGLGHGIARAHSVPVGCMTVTFPGPFASVSGPPGYRPLIRPAKTTLHRPGGGGARPFSGRSLPAISVCKSFSRPWRQRLPPSSGPNPGVIVATRVKIG